MQEHFPLFLSRLQLPTIPSRCCQESACRAVSCLLRAVAPCIRAEFTLWLACVHNANLSGRGQGYCEIGLLSELYSSSSRSEKENSYLCRGGREQGLSAPPATAVLTATSVGKDCCRDEIKAAASPSAVHLHWYLHSLPKWHHYHLLSICTTGMCFT